MIRKYLRTYRHLFIATLALVVLILISSVALWLITGQKYSFVDAFYMTFITLTTIGYGEIIDLSNNPWGRILVIAIALSGIGILTYILTNVTAIIVEGKLTDSIRRRRMEKKIQELEGHYIVCGIGNVGIHIVNELYATGRKVVLIDNNTGLLVNFASDHPGVLYIGGDATDNSVLGAANIQKAAGIFVATDDDNQNLVICFSARQLNRNIRVVARCAEIKNQAKLSGAGADSIISPNYIGGLRMASEMVRPTVVSFLDVMMRDEKEKLRVEEFAVSEKHAGKDIQSLDIRRFPSSLLLAVRSEGKWMYNPRQDYVIKRGDSLIIMTNPQERMDLEAVMK
jgi:voltage-gated potassium channel